ncbi:MAG: 5'/3'-nucleotidase SurE [bacterium]|nr:5'/3'-nucleotidase SurE [bacterium]
MKILLTNDDSHDSPLFHYAIERFQEMGDLKVVVPKEEQSWKGKSMTRFEPMDLETRTICGVTAHILDGTPADCANFGIYHLFEDKPDLVISGVNMGSNVGIGFAFSSGTIGACLEGNIAGVPGIAISQLLDRSLFRQWYVDRSFPEDVLARLHAQSDRLLDRVFEDLYHQDGFWKTPVTWNVNLPYEAVPDCDLVWAFLGQTFYGSCFKKEDGKVVHDLDTVKMDEREQADGVVVRGGHVSLTRLDMRSFGQV